MEQIKINDIDIFLEDYTDGKGKIIVSSPYGNYSHYWGAMGTDIKSFLKSIDVDYFVGKLIGAYGEVFDAKATFNGIRKYIKNELGWSGLKWYRHTKFQKDMREKLNDFQSKCKDGNYFVYTFSSFINDLDFSLLDKNERNYNSDDVEADIRSLNDEPWLFIQTKKSDEYKRLEKLFEQLKKQLITQQELVLV